MRQLSVIRDRSVVEQPRRAERSGARASTPRSRSVEGRIETPVEYL